MFLIPIFWIVNIVDILEYSTQTISWSCTNDSIFFKRYCGNPPVERWGLIYKILSFVSKSLIFVFSYKNTLFFPTKLIDSFLIHPFLIKNDSQYWPLPTTLSSMTIFSFFITFPFPSR